MKETNPLNNPTNHLNESKEDSQESFLKSHPFNSVLNSLQIEDTHVRYQLFDLDDQTRSEIQATLQDLSDQETLFFAMDPKERKGKNFDVSGLIELKKRYKDNEKVITFINNQVVPSITKNADKLFNIELNFTEREKLIKEKKFEEECNKYAVDGEAYLDTFLKDNKDEKYGRHWSWSLSKDRKYIDMNTFMSEINEKYAPVSVEDRLIYKEKGKSFESNFDWWGPEKLKEYLKGKRVVGVRDSISLYLRVMSEISQNDIKDPFREKEKKNMEKEKKNIANNKRIDYKAINRDYAEEKEVDGEEYIKDLFTVGSSFSSGNDLIASENFTWKLSEDKKYIKLFMSTMFIDKRFIMKEKEIKSFSGTGQKGSVNLIDFLKGKKIKAIDSKGDLILEIVGTKSEK